MNTSSTYTSISRMALAERIADKRYNLDAISSLPWFKEKAGVVKQLVDDLYQLTVQMQNMR